MAGNLFRLCIKVLGKFFLLCIEVLAKFFRFFIPLMIRGIGYALIMLVTTVIVIGKSIQASADDIAFYWMKELAKEQIDSYFDTWHKWVAYISTYTLLIVGWILLAHLTVYLMEVLVWRWIGTAP